MNATNKRLIRNFFSPIRRIGLKNKAFTIISSDCWGGIVYDILGLQYKTPTIGLLISGKDFIKFCLNLDHYLSIDIVADKIANEKDLILNRNAKNPRWYGLLGDLTVKFIHYKTLEDAIVKWNKRRKRVDYNNILIHFDDKTMNGVDADDIDKLAQLSYPIIFTTSNRYYLEKYDFAYYVKDITMKEVFRRVPLRKIKKIVNEQLPLLKKD